MYYEIIDYYFTCFCWSATEKRKIEKCFLGARVWVPKPVYRSPKWPGYVTDSSLLSLTDECGGVSRDWCWLDLSENSFCQYCGSTFSFSSPGFHDLKQHLKTQTNKNNHKAVHNKKIPKIAPVFQSDFMVQSSSSNGYFKPQQPVIGIPSMLADHTASAEILWMLKIISANYSLRSCDSITKLFHNMFSCDITKNNDSSLDRNNHTVSQMVLEPF